MQEPQGRRQIRRRFSFYTKCWKRHWKKSWEHRGWTVAQAESHILKESKPDSIWSLDISSWLRDGDATPFRVALVESHCNYFVPFGACQDRRDAGKWWGSSRAPPRWFWWDHVHVQRGWEGWAGSAQRAWLCFLQLPGVNGTGRTEPDSSWRCKAKEWDRKVMTCSQGNTKHCLCHTPQGGSGEWALPGVVTKQ